MAESSSASAQVTDQRDKEEEEKKVDLGEGANKDVKKDEDDGTAAEEDETGAADDGDMDSIEAELAAGSRAFAFKNYAVATECFSKACERLNTHHSQNHSAIIDAHISYGKALLRNAISLGSLLGGVSTNNGHSEADGPEGPATNGHSSLNDKTPAAQAGAPSTSKASSSTTKPACKQNAQIHFSGDSSDEENAEDGEDPADDDEAAEEPVTVEEELENAFQVLEFALQTIQTQIQSISDQQGSSELEKLQSKLIDVHDLIAQVHQEGERFDLAVEAYRNSLELKKSRKGLAPGTIAETHLMIALALELIPDNPDSMKQAIEHVNEAIQLMKGHLAHLSSKSQGPETGVAEEPNKPVDLTDAGEKPISKTESSKPGALASEIEEVKSLIDELEAKREELKTVPQPAPLSEADKALQEYLTAINKTASTGTPNGKAVINDLSNLVKKRARPLDSSSGLPPDSLQPAHADQPLQSPSKKPKI